MSEGLRGIDRGVRGGGVSSKSKPHGMPATAGVTRVTTWNHQCGP